MERNCLNCAHHEWYGPDNYEMSLWVETEGWVCTGRKENVHNLKSFPFKKEQKCFKSHEERETERDGNSCGL